MMKQLIEKITTRLRPRRMKMVAPPLLAALLLVSLSLASCLDETLVSTTYGQGDAPSPEDADMYLSVNVPRTTFSLGSYADKESTVETLDVLVFAKGKADPANYYVHAACKGTLTKDANKFQVVMPVGNDFIVHVFANCHDAMVARKFYNSRGREMSAMLADLTEGTDVNPASLTSLPMHGYVTGVTIDKSKVNTKLDVPVLRSVAAVQVMTKASGTDGSYTPGDVKDDDGNKNFELRELYVYFYPDSGRVAAASDAYEPLNPGDDDQTRDVTKVSLPSHHRVSDTRMVPIDPDKPNPKPYNIISATAVGKLGCLYLYENKPYSDTGFDQPDADNPAATSRIVVGGVYNNEKEADGTTPKVTYYRIDFADADNHLSEVLRNHKYTFSIEKVSGTGYDTPDDAATGVPINIYIKVIDWTDDLEHVDFDRQNRFYSETKHIVLPRNANSVRSIIVDSDVPVDEWKLSFKTAANGVTVPATVSADGKTVTPTANATLANNRYKVEKSIDGKSLVFTALKAYKDLTAGESLNETLILKAKELEITYHITQKDQSADDWGNGGDLETDLGENPKKGAIEVEGLDFVVAPANVVLNEATSECTFATDQGDYGYYFIFDGIDYCQKINKYWYTPSVDQITQLSAKQIWGTWKKKDGTLVNGIYMGTTKVPLPEEQRKYIFLPAGGYRWGNGAVGTNNVTERGRYNTSEGTPGDSGTRRMFEFIYNDHWITGDTSRIALSLRCVCDK